MPGVPDGETAKQIQSLAPGYRGTLTEDTYLAEDLVRARLSEGLGYREMVAKIHRVTRKRRGLPPEPEEPATGTRKRVSGVPQQGNLERRLKYIEQVTNRCTLKEFAKDLPAVLDEEIVNSPKQLPILACLARWGSSEQPPIYYPEDIITLKFFFNPKHAFPRSPLTSLSDGDLASLLGMSRPPVVAMKNRVTRLKTIEKAVPLGRLFHMMASFMRRVNQAMAAGNVLHAAAIFEAKDAFVEALREPGSELVGIDVVAHFYKKMGSEEGFSVPPTLDLHQVEPVRLIPYHEALPDRWRDWRWPEEVLEEFELDSQDKFEKDKELTALLKSATSRRPSWSECHPVGDPADL